MLAGVSGIGKTTVANWISETYGIPFKCGSFTALVESERGKTHKDMLDEPLTTKQRVDKEYKLLKARVALTTEGNFVSDRSFLDTAAYFALKLSTDLPTCEIEDYLALCFQVAAKHTTHLILLNYGYDNYGWDFENNNLRIVNKWFQLQVGNLMRDVLDNWDYLSDKYYPQSLTNIMEEDKGAIYQDSSYSGTYYSSEGNKFRYLILNSTGYETRENIIKNFLSE